MSYTIRIETHDAICADLHKKIRELIVENEHLRQSLIRLREQGRETDEQQPRSESGPSSN